MTDFLVIGSGIAGLSFALRAAQIGQVLVITKKSDCDSATNQFGPGRSGGGDGGGRQF